MASFGLSCYSLKEKQSFIIIYLWRREPFSKNDVNWNTKNLGSWVLDFGSGPNYQEKKGVRKSA